jgi:hypothetical protein
MTDDTQLTPHARVRPWGQAKQQQLFPQATSDIWVHNLVAIYTISSNEINSNLKFHGVPTQKMNSVLLYTLDSTFSSCETRDLPRNGGASTSLQTTMVPRLAVTCQDSNYSSNFIEINFSFYREQSHGLGSGHFSSQSNTIHIPTQSVCAGFQFSNSSMAFPHKK